VRAHHLAHPEILLTVKLLQTHQLDFMLHRPIPDNHYFWYYATGRENPDFHRRWQLYQEFAAPLDPLALERAVTQACQFVAIDPRQGDESSYERIKHALPALK